MSEELDDLLAQLGDDKLPEVRATPTTVIDPELPEDLIDVAAHVRRHESISDEILSSWRSDRTETQGVINMIHGLIEKCVSSGERPPGAYVEGLVGAMKAKADTNATAVRLLDATAKLLTTVKPTVNVKNTTNNTLTINSSLSEILAEPVMDDDV